jgi:hypothetical protein
VGAFAKTTGGAPAQQPIIGAGFRPGLVLFSSVQDVTETGVSIDHVRFGIGAVDGVHQVSSAFSDSNGVAPSIASAMDVADTAFVKVNNATRTVDARADVASLDSNGFTLNWTVNDAVATEVCYAALGAR